VKAVALHAALEEGARQREHPLELRPAWRERRCRSRRPAAARLAAQHGLDRRAGCAADGAGASG
jgi:hypothetical protein